MLEHLAGILECITVNKLFYNHIRNVHPLQFSIEWIQHVAFYFARLFFFFCCFDGTYMRHLTADVYVLPVENQSVDFHRPINQRTNSIQFHFDTQHESERESEWQIFHVYSAEQRSCFFHTSQFAKGHDHKRNCSGECTLCYDFPLDNHFQCQIIQFIKANNTSGLSMVSLDHFNVAHMDGWPNQIKLGLCVCVWPIHTCLKCFIKNGPAKIFIIFQYAVVHRMNLYGI